jgi:hypothetical protein
MSRAQEKMQEHIATCTKCKEAKTLADMCTKGYILQRVISSEQTR